MDIKGNKILVIIPAYNEESSIKSVIVEIRKYLEDAEIIVIDDGSKDNTAEYAAGEKAIVLRHPFNIGIGASFQTGCQYASLHGYDYIVRVDADEQHDPSFIKDILEPLEEGEADITIGSRFLIKSGYKSSLSRLMGIQLISFILSIISKNKVTDSTSGFCAMNKKAFNFFAKECADDYPEPEILIHHKSFKMKEVPVLMKKRSCGVSSISFSDSIYYVFKVLFSLFVNIFR